MTTKSLNPRDTTRILNLARKGAKIANGSGRYLFDSLGQCADTFDKIAVIAKGIDARETRRDPSLRRKPAKKRRVLKAEAKA